MPVAALTENFSPMSRMAPPPLGSDTDGGAGGPPSAGCHPRPLYPQRHRACRFRLPRIPEPRAGIGCLTPPARPRDRRGAPLSLPGGRAGVEPAVTNLSRIRPACAGVSSMPPTAPESWAASESASKPLPRSAIIGLTSEFGVVVRDDESVADVAGCAGISNVQVAGRSSGRSLSGCSRRLIAPQKNPGHAPSATHANSRTSFAVVVVLRPEADEVLAPGCGVGRGEHEQQLVDAVYAPAGNEREHRAGKAQPQRAVPAVASSGWCSGSGLRRAGQASGKSWRTSNSRRPSPGRRPRASRAAASRSAAPPSRAV